jgi:hypothetical protein
MSIVHTWSKYSTSPFKAGEIEDEMLGQTVRCDTYSGKTYEGKVVMAREMISTGDVAWTLVLSVSEDEPNVFIPIRDVQQMEVF